MKYICPLITLLFLTVAVYAQTPRDVSVELTAIPSTSPAAITLKWRRITYDTSYYNVWKKSKTATSWGSAIATMLPNNDTTFVDNAVIIDSAYEYAVEAISPTIISNGYIYAGIHSPAMHYKGTMIVLVDSTFIDSCAAGIKTLMNDLSGDGWQVIRHNFLRTKSDTAIKNVIASDYALYPNVKALLLLGHLAVPYSGLFNASGYYPPDGHVPYHDGAWPADIYYACIPSSGWTDVGTNDSASYTANQNLPGDGKWDQVMIPSPAVLQVSRVDFYNMPSFSATEVQLMNNYLARDHTYKMDSLGIIHRALVNDNFGYFGGESFAANGWRNFSPLVGFDSVQALPFVSTLASSSYQWAYGCGGGSFTSASGVGVTSDFATNPVNGIFLMMFGSYFGDWNTQDDFLRAPLCSGTPALTNCWAGRPNWFFHHMALGENIGYSSLLTQNNGGLYQPPGYGNQFVHVALMGDLSLRTDYIKPVSNLTITAPYHNGAILNWTASPDSAVIGYYIYRADSAYGYYQRLNTTAVTATTYHDLYVAGGLKYYMVRPVKLQSTPSGGYYNLGIGITDTVTILSGTLQAVSVQPSLEVNIYPNPAVNYLNVTINASQSCTGTLYIVDADGRISDMATKELNAGSNGYMLNTSNYVPGVYSVVLYTSYGQVTKKWVKL